MSDPTPFLIVSAGRTGSNLLRSLLKSHPQVFCGGEIFNREYVEREGVPWPAGGAEQDPALRTMMRDDPATYVRRLFELASPGHRAVGAKLTYENAAAHPAATDHLVAIEGNRVIHLKRHNLLRVYVSLQRAMKTGQWMSRGDSGPPPPVHIDFVKLVRYLLRHQEHEDKVDALFAGHAKMQVYYEDLAADPVGVAARCVAFLGLDASVPLWSDHKKSGTDPLSRAIENYAEVRGAFARWLSFFDD